MERRRNMATIPKSRPALLIGLTIGLVALLVLVGVALAAGESIPRSQIGSGGGEISGGGLGLRTTIGQPFAGTVSNGPTVCSGLLCGPQVPSSPGDTTPPTVVDTSPADGATSVPRNTTIVVDFSEAMNTASVSTLITPSASLTATWSLGDTRLTLTDDNLAASTRYTATVDAGLDLAGNPLGNAPFTWVFTTSAEVAPEADLALSKTWTGPADGTAIPGSVMAGERITYTFTITNGGPTTPVTATLVDTFSSASALAGVSGSGCAWTPGSTNVTCTVTDVSSGSPAQLTLIVTTSETFSGTLGNTASIAPTGGVIDRNPANDTDGLTVTIRRDTSGDQFIYLPLIVNQ
jgi:uncharacterized repeat protein (TIGR01451 family)